MCLAWSARLIGWQVEVGLCEEEREVAKKEAAKLRSAEAMTSAQALATGWEENDFTFSQPTQRPPLDTTQDGHAVDEPEHSEGLGGEQRLVMPDDSVEAADASLVVAGPRRPEREVTPVLPDDVRAMDYGYGEGGATVQGALHAVRLTDRFIMRATLLAGTPTVVGRKVCDSLRSTTTSGRKALPMPKWKAVMEAGLSDCTIAKVVNKTAQDASIVIRPIPVDASDKVQYHNELMRLCRVTLRELTTEMQKASSKVHARSGEAAVLDRSRSPRAAGARRMRPARRSAVSASGTQRCAATPPGSPAAADATGNTVAANDDLRPAAAKPL